MTILDKIKELQEKSKKRNFKQRYDLIINLKEFNPEKVENKLDEIFVLPKGLGKENTITLFHPELKELEGCKIFNSAEIEELGKNKKALSNLMNKTDLFLSEPKLMPVVGKFLGKYLAPRGLMPKPIVGDVSTTVKKYKNAVRLVIKKQPIIQTVIGTEAMKEEDIVENVKAVLEFIKSKLPRGKNNIGTVYLKLTMSKPVKIEVQ